MTLLSRGLAAVLVMASLTPVVAHGAAPQPQNSSEQQQDDGRIAAQVQAVLADGALNLSGLSVKSVQGVVELSGIAASAEDARRAIELVRQVPGVRGVKNDLKVG